MRSGRYENNGRGVNVSCLLRSAEVSLGRTFRFFCFEFSGKYFRKVCQIDTSTNLQKRIVVAEYIRTKLEKAT